ncbi:hypothetical protein LSCM1_00469 [Leishmania martiniquensis]|uniref:HECT domain-containing protein n=1 Tax=Leishmania martiniquensis TaxID=1580590 RepID=A0A836KG40_9TRYP|nr:hypothetical protein LSCM1_00469 [Leishmania martiniquensis]
MIGSLALLSDIRSAYLASYDRAERSGNEASHPVCGGTDQTSAGSAPENARKRLEEHLGFLCTAICIAGEDYVRSFPTNLYVPLLTKILTAALMARRDNACAANPFFWGGCESNISSTFNATSQHLHEVLPTHRLNGISSLCMPCMGVQAASPVEILVLRALALIADIVPNGSRALCPTKTTDTIATLALYLSDPEFLAFNEDLSEELLKCFLYVSVVAHDACLGARVPLRLVELLLVLAPLHLRLLCVQVMSNLLSRAIESDLEEVWSSVMAKFLESFDSFLFESSFRLNSPATARRATASGSSTLTAPPAAPAAQRASTAATTTAYSTSTSERSLSSKEATLLQHYMEAISHTVDRLFVGVDSMKAHMKLLQRIIQVCVQLLHLSLSLAPATCGEWVRSVALSPIIGFYLANPTLAVPMLLQLRVWEAVCGCMLRLVERCEAAPKAFSAAAGGGTREREIAAGARASDVASNGDRSANSTFSAASPLASSSSRSRSDSGGHGGADAASAIPRPSATLRSSPALTTGPVLTTDVTTIPFIADELRLLPLLEFLLVLLPCARREHSHTDFRNTTLPYFGWTWEDDFHNEMECNETLSRRLERVYQQTRKCRTHELFAVTQGKQRIFYTDFLSKSFLSERRERHCLHRKPLLTGYIHDTQNALRHGCTCCTSEPAPLFSTWVNRNYMRLRTADTQAGEQRRGRNRDAAGDAGDENHASPAVGPASRETATMPSLSPRSPRANGARGGEKGADSPSSSPRERGLVSSPQMGGVDSRDEDGNRDAATRQSARAESRGPGTPREGSRGAAIVHTGGRLPRSTHDEAAEENVAECDFSSNTSAVQGESLPRRARRRGGKLGFLLCRCGSDETATSQNRRRPMQMRAYLPETPAFPHHHRRPLAITMLPMDAMLEGPGERLQADPATRKAFLGKGVLSSILSTMVPALLSVLDNCVNPLVARHSVALLLRCLSLSADLRTQVTGESIECLPSGGSGEEGAVVMAALEAGEKKGRRRMAFRKLISGGSGRNPKGWQRREWENAQAALQRLLPSLREVLVSLYVADGVSIVAERQEIFGPVRDDLLMRDELARVGLSSDFFGFQLALPSEQHVCTADAIVLLLGLLSTPKSTMSVASAASLKTFWKGKRVSSLHISPRLNIKDGMDAAAQLSMAPSMSSFVVSAQESVVEHSSSQAAQAALQSQLWRSHRLTAASLTPLGSPALQCGSPVSQEDHVHVMRPSPPTSRPAGARRHDSVEGKMNTLAFIGAGVQHSPHISPTTRSRPSSPSFSQTGNTSGSSSRDSVHDSFFYTPNAASANSGGLGGGGVFTLHQSSLLVSYARQIVSRSRKVCGAAQRIHESMNEKMYCTRCVIGSSEAGNGERPPSRSRELTLRLFPDASCPYHSTFPACAETFFHASQALLAAMLAAGGPLTATSTPSVAASRRPLTGPETAAFSAVIAAAPPHAGRRAPTASFTAPPSEGADTAVPMLSQVISQVKGEEVPMEVELSFIPATVDAAAVQKAINRAMEDETGMYRRLPRALRGVLGFYDYCKQLNIELRAAVVETPEVLGKMAADLEKWLLSRARQREETGRSTTSFALSSYRTNHSFDSSASRGVDGAPVNQQHLRLDSTARGKLLCLTADFAAAIGRDLGLATLDLAPSVVMKQPCSFQKRARRLKIFDSIRYLVWRPLSIALELKKSRTPEPGQSSSLTIPDAATAGPRDATFAEAPVVMLGRAELPIVAGVTLRNAVLSALPTTTIGSLAEAVAAQIQLPPAAGSALNSFLKASQQSPPTKPLCAMQESQGSSDSGSSTADAGSVHFVSQKTFEKRHTDTSAVGPPITADRILFFLNDTPLFSPMTTLLDALTAFSVSGASLRDLVAMQRSSSESAEVYNAKIALTLPTLPFWTMTHVLGLVVLAEPLPASLILDLATTMSASPERSCCCCCGCDGLRPAFLCSPKHLFDAAPPSGPLALYSALSTLMREEVGSSPASLESDQRRLSSAVVHELYHQLNMFMLPPLLWCSGIGHAAGGGPVGEVASTAAMMSAAAFPLPSYVLWHYPFIFSAEMRLSIFKFFISAQRSLSRDEANRLLQSHRHLLVRRASPEEGRAAASCAAGGTEKTLDVVGLEWLSEEVARRYRVTLTVQRHNVLRCAEELIRLATCNVTVDVAFEGEAGIGNGPAMEFFEMVAEELVDPKHGLWRTEPVPDEEATESLPPLPLSTSSYPRIAADVAPRRRRPCTPLFPAAKQTPTSLHYWKLLGVLLGRLLVIGATSPLSFHPLLLRRLRGESLISTETEASRNMSQLDAALELTLCRLETMSDDTLAACELFFTIPASEADGCAPGASEEQPLMPGGASRQITPNNVYEYTHGVRRYYLQTVLDLALLHLRQGLQLTVNPLYLQLFNADELGRLLCSPQDAKIWETREQFARQIEPAHGYHINSDVVQYLLDVVPSWSAQLQHAFLKFVTGSSAVPYGGLTRRIKVVRRDVDISAVDLSVTPTAHSFGANSDGLVTTSSVGFVGTNYDNSLPTVSTCFLYLKLPQYSSKAVLQDRLLFAVCEGQSFFSLT